MKILLIEHDARDVRRFKELLNEAAKGYCDITVARRLSRALAKLSAEPFDIVLLELALPDSQGLDTFLKAHALAPGTPFLVLTGQAGEESAIGAVGRGAHDYFIKGQVDGASLVRAMRYAIEHARREEMLRRNAAVLHMLQEMTVATNEADTLEQAMRFCLERICNFMRWPIGHIYVCANGNEDSLFRCDIWYLTDETRFKGFREASEQLKPVPGSSLTAQVLRTGQAAWVKDVHKHPSFRRFKAAKEAGVRSAFAFPVLEGKKVVAILEFFSERVAEADDAMLEAITNLGTQLGRVTERIQAQQALRQSEQRFRDLIEGSIQGILIQRKRRPLFANQAYAGILGYASPAEILAAPSIDVFFAPYERARVREYNKIRLAGGQAPSQYEYDAIRKDGSVVTLQNVVRVISWEGAPAIQSTVVDITERRRAEATLKAVIDAVPAMISAKDECSRYIFMNRYQAELYGISPETAVGKTAAEILNAEYGAYTEALDGEVLTTGKAIPYFEEQYTDAHNVMRTFLTTKVPLHRVKAQVKQLATVSLDITQRKRAEEEIERLNEELEQRVLDRTTELEAANRELEAFSYSVSHDLRAPLRHVSGFIELLQKHALASLDEQGQRYLNIISQSAERMGMLIDDLLNFSRAGRLELHKSAVDLGKLVREVLDELGSEIQGRAIEWKIDPLPVVHADRSMLRLVLLNLIANAVKFTRAREHARIEIATQPDPTNRVIISVRDNGAGFDMKYIDKLFNVFQRLHSVDQYEGTGIGLASVRRIIQRHGGETWAEGEIDKGAVFHFSLPRPQKGERDEQAQTDIAGGGRRQRHRVDAHGTGGT